MATYKYQLRVPQGLFEALSKAGAENVKATLAQAYGVELVFDRPGRKKGTKDKPKAAAAVRHHTLPEGSRPEGQPRKLTIAEMVAANEAKRAAETQARRDAADLVA